MKGRKSKSWAMAYCGMAAALSVVLMLLGAVFPIAMFIAPAVASFLIATVCVECGKTMALTAYGAVSLLSLLFVPDKEVALTFVFLLGYYPLAKPYFERIRPALLRAVCKLLLCNGGILAMYGLVLSGRADPHAHPAGGQAYLSGAPGRAGGAAGPGGQHRRRAAHYGDGRLAGDAGHGQCSLPAL